jgi:hypothetical protein
MNDSESDKAKLLADAFYDDWSTGAPLHYARAAAKFARRRRATRHAVAATSVVIAAAALVLGVGMHLRARSSPRSPERLAGSRQNYEIISDTELLAQVRDRPLLALRDSNRITKVILLGND